MSEEAETRNYDAADWPDKLAFELGREGFKFILVTATRHFHEVRIMTLFSVSDTLEILVKTAKMLSLVVKDHPSMWDGAFLVSGGKRLDGLAAKTLARLADDDRLYMLYVDGGDATCVCVRGEPFDATHFVTRAAAMVENSSVCALIPPPSQN